MRSGALAIWPLAVLEHSENAWVRKEVTAKTAGIVHLRRPAGFPLTGSLATGSATIAVALPRRVVSLR
ncbi:hypothetical protein GCM10017655_24590 [Pseudomonas turukhanskensis]|uniref:Uncharacterized protein n=1 Tax=Pseudomonas turukhanskensis TaxID=1806536 RepID=A0A9W6NG19_9PSED|nr:hypothetical protein GCM10017655_24590 [Pseudomonas turukhanskensis]